MLSKLLISLLLVSASIVGAAVKPGENILINGTFECQGEAAPSYWYKGGSNVSCSPTGGPGKTGALIFSNPKGLKGTSANSRQHDLQLVAGETYKMSADVKTAGFKSAHCGVIVIDNGWHKEYGLKSFPENTDGWQHVEQTFVLQESKNGVYGAVIFAIDYVGEIQFAQVKLEAISAGALANSSPSRLLTEQNRPRLVAWEPLLNAIPLGDPKITFRFFGKTERALGEYDCLATIDGATVRKHPLAAERNTVDLSGLAAGDHTLNVAIVDRAAQAKVFDITHMVTLKAVPKVDTSAHRRLNNLAVEVLAKPLQRTAATQRFEFITARDGWVFIKVETAAEEPALDVRVGADDTVITANTARREAFRELPRGKHSLAVKGAASGGKILVRSIAEVFNYPALGNSQVPQNGKYDWDFHVRHVFPAVTTLNGGNIPEERRAELRRMGLKWLGSVGTTDPKDAADLVERMSKTPGMTAPWYDGFTTDEQFFGTPALVTYTEALRLLKNPDNRLIYTWIVGKPGFPGLHNDFMSAALNASRGRGRLLFEIYCHSRSSEQDAATYLKDRLVDTMARVDEYFPNAAEGTGMILGNFNQIPIISLDVNPEVDYKYYLDMQMHLIATDPRFKDLAVTGYWGSYYDDEELYRWSMRLLRHYCVEGNTEMLSKGYGYRYSPGHLSNCDFVEGLKGWTADPAEGVRAESFAGYGKGSQGRWGAGGKTGDSFCVFKRGGRPATLTQTATGLTTGKVYTLQFVTADYKDMVAHKVDPKQHRLSAVLGAGAEVIPEKSYVFVDERTSGKKADDGLARINLHHIRFRATAPSFKVTFTDAEADPGTETAFNYIMLKPYFED
ncbi:MAG: carbohydrate binding domain-containing protein [Armatimonadota bacterium]